MSRSVLRAIIGAAVIALLAAFYLNGSRDVRRGGAAPERVTGALEVEREQASPARGEDVRSGRDGVMLTLPHRIDAGTGD
jgi:hypothetical protein